MSGKIYGELRALVCKSYFLRLPPKEYEGDSANSHESLDLFPPFALFG